MILLWLVLVLLIGGVLAWLADYWYTPLCRWLSLATLAVDLWLALRLWSMSPKNLALAGNGPWVARLDWSWIPSFGIHFHLAADGLSILMVVLSVVLGLASVVASWTEIRERVGFFHFNLLWSLAGTLGVFLAFDMFLFFFFWEVMLVPMYFLIAIWGDRQRINAAVKFFLFTQGSGLFMLIALLGLVFVHHQATGVYTFDYFQLLGTHMAPRVAMWLMLGFFLAFAVKLPSIPFHTWLPDAYTSAPTGAVVVLAGAMAKTGAYGLIRFVVPLFPDAAHRFAPVAMALGVAGILYGAMLAFAQSDLKRLVAYSSISHLGFILLGVFAWNLLALQGAIMQMIAHGFTAGALFIMVGAIEERLHTRQMNRMGDLWTRMPRMGAIGLFFALASLGLPGLANFVGEFLVLLGAYRVDVTLTVFAAAGLVTATAYALILVQKVFHGQPGEHWQVADFGPRHMTVMLTIIAIVVWLGVYPAPVLDTARVAIAGLRHPVATLSSTGHPS
ncbi:MAG TPA: NADH-quinone oxidoreductase subunit M [Gammaproteobacteria bacterium]|nr:NADH-quinone oxidoreductase subunit M [Gammaproteobacteria bacterium]